MERSNLRERPERTCEGHARKTGRLFGDDLGFSQGRLSNDRHEILHLGDATRVPLKDEGTQGAMERQVVQSRF